jgi:hypothetical protein
MKEQCIFLNLYQHLGLQAGLDTFKVELQNIQMLKKHLVQEKEEKVNKPS